MALWTIRRLTFSPPASPSLSGWQAIMLDKESGETQTILFPGTAPDPGTDPDVFLCYIEEEYSLTPNDFGSPCP